MADYVAVIDDSGGVEPLIRWGGDFVSGDHPITCLMALVIEDNLLEEFDAKWLILREKIQTALNTSELPPIHLRLMYGRNLPPKYRGKPNPYLNSNFDQIVDWISEGLEIIKDFNHQRKLAWVSASKSREIAAEPLKQYWNDPDLVAELHFLKHHSRGIRKNMGEKYLKKVASPLLPLLTEILLYLHEMMKVFGNKNVSLKVDPFSDAHGLDAKTTFETISTLCNLSNLTSIEVMRDGDELSISQAVDLLGFINFRFTMMQLKHIRNDRIVTELTQRYKMKPLFSANINHIISRKYRNISAITTTIHYAVARRVIEQIDVSFADEYLVSIEELKHRAEEFIKNGAMNAGLSILKDPSVCQHLIKPQNGEDPG